MNRISSEIEAHVLEAWFNAVPRGTIASNFRISGSTVSAITNSLLPCLQAQRQPSLQLRKLDMKPKDALQGINFLQELAEQGMTPDQFSIYIGARWHQQLKRTPREQLL